MEESIRRKYDAAQQSDQDQQGPGYNTEQPTSSSSAPAPTPTPVFTSGAAAGSVSFNRLAQVRACVWV
jgi:hypothetical protein